MRLLMLFPESTWILLIVLLGIGVIVRLISVKKAFGIIGLLLLIALTSPFIKSLILTLPRWVLLILLFFTGIFVFNFVIRIFFGRGTLERLWAMILHDIILLPFRLFGALLRRK
jgi:hypothetical protein